jgi:hypothetical protein
MDHVVTRSAIALTAAAASLLAAACSTASAPHPAPEPGYITGVLTRAGGPAPRSPVPLPGHVTATGPADSGVAAADRGGRFRLVLAPGVYRLTGRSPLINSGHQICLAGHPVRVRPGKVTAAVRVICSVR